MPSYFPENNEPKPMDSADRSLQKINDLLRVGSISKPYTGTIVDRSGTVVSSNTSQQIAEANSARAYLVFQNLSDATMYVNFGAVATIDSNSIKVNSGGSITFNGGWVPGDSVNVICSASSKKFIAKEGI